MNENREKWDETTIPSQGKLTNNAEIITWKINEKNMMI